MLQAPTHPSSPYPFRLVVIPAIATPAGSQRMTWVDLNRLNKSCPIHVGASSMWHSRKTETCNSNLSILPKSPCVLDINLHCICHFRCFTFSLYDPREEPCNVIAATPTKGITDMYMPVDISVRVPTVMKSHGK